MGVHVLGLQHRPETSSSRLADATLTSFSISWSESALHSRTARVLGARCGRAAALFSPRAQRSPGARRGPRPWATPWGSAINCSALAGEHGLQWWERPWRVVMTTSEWGGARWGHVFRHTLETHPKWRQRQRREADLLGSPLLSCTAHLSVEEFSQGPQVGTRAVRV